MKARGWRKFLAMTGSLLVCWHVALTGIGHQVDLVALAVLLAAIYAGPAAYMGANVWKEHVRIKSGGKKDD